jgi:hypothetical protein
MFTLKQLKDAILPETPKVPESLDEQYAALERTLAQQQASEGKRLRNQWPAGWFKMMGRQGFELFHWCPDCKTLSQGKVAVHCGSRKREQRPEGRIRLALLPKAYWRLF